MFMFMALGRGSSNSIAAAAFICKASFLVKGHEEFCKKMLRMRCDYLWGKTQWVRHYWLFNQVQQGYANNRSRKGLVSLLRNCRWIFFLTSLFITMSTKFGHSLALLQNGRRQTQFSRGILCPVFIISFLADQDPLKLSISSHQNHPSSFQLRKPKVHSVAYNQSQQIRGVLKNVGGLKKWFSTKLFFFFK